ncbi:MAG: ATP-binding cassette domain-containing protein [Puniceicoccaceae bacterium]|nr:MAG: ATP-binding cassette domain-containing protein [Puniceicoccaceae bacterium]
MLALRKVSLAFGGAPLLDEVSLDLRPGERICLLGRNGSGKTSLFRLLLGELRPDGGEVHRPAGCRVAALPQVVPADLGGTVAEVVAAGLEAGLAEWEREPRLRRVLGEHGLDGATPFAGLSAGMKRRVLLARCLAGAPDVLLLDEPTNHLDLPAIRALEDRLQRFAGTLFFITHDRAFLRNLANRILELDRGSLLSWDCDYTTYLERREAHLLGEERQRAEADKKLAREEAWIREGIKARRTRNEGRVRRLKALREEHRARRDRLGSVRMEVEDAERSGEKVIVAEAVTCGYGGDPVIREFSCVLRRGDRIGLVGPNGAGKSTLLKVLLGEKPPTAGRVVHGTNLRVAYFDQLRERLDESASLVENLAGGNETVEINGRTRHVMSYLQDFLFTPDRARGPVRELSGGERNRLLLARLLTRPCNLLVLDEPTNDLDLETLELLEDLLGDYGGTLLLVSHDRAFLDQVVTDLWILEGDGAVQRMAGGYSDYEALLRRREAAAAPPERRDSNGGGRKPKTRKFLNRERWELEALPGEIEALETEQAALTERLADPGFHAEGGDGPAAVQVRLREIEAELEARFARWEALEQLRQELEG